MNNHLWKLIEKYPNKLWEWKCISINPNPNLTLEWIEKYSNKP